MKKLKHSKYKNTGIIFELLSRQVTSDLLETNNSKSLSILKKYFKEGTELYKELLCYQALSEAKKKSNVGATKLVDIIIEQRNSINSKKLLHEKYGLIGAIKDNYVLESFFDSRIPNYKLFASIYKLFENKSFENPSDYVEQYDILIEHLTSSRSLVKQDEDAELWKNQPDDIKPLALKMIIERFNDKYKDLSPKQKTMVSRYINENIDLDPFKNYVFLETTNIKNQLVKIKRTMTDESLKIKLSEAIKLADNILTSKRISTEHISSILKYYELIDFLKGNA